MVTSVAVAALALVELLDALGALDVLDVLAFDPESLLQAAAKATTQTRPTRNVSGARVRVRVWLLIRRYYGSTRACGCPFSTGRQSLPVELDGVALRATRT
jgi:hypothetical protein